MVVTGDRSGSRAKGSGEERRGGCCSRPVFNSSFIQKRFIIHARIT